MNAKIALTEYRNGTSIQRLAARYGLTEKTVYNRLINANGGRPLTGKAGAHKLGVCRDLASRNRAVTDNRSKFYRELGEVLGLSSNTIYRIASRAS